MFASLLIWPIRMTTTPPRREPVTFDLVFAGIAFIWRNPLILGAISLDLFAVLLGGATGLLPVFARDVFDAGPRALGLLQLSPALGALSMSILLARWLHAGARGSRASRLRLSPASAAPRSCSACRQARSSLTMLALVAYGATDMVSVVIRETLIQVGTPDSMRGRVNAVHSLFVGTSNQLGQFRAGVMAAWLGTIPAVVLGGFATLVVVAFSQRAFPELSRVKSVEDISAPVSAAE